MSDKPNHSRDSIDQPSFPEKARYYVDLFLSWSPVARFIGLFVLSFILVAITATLSMFASKGDSPVHQSFLEAMWWAMMRVIDSGAMAEDSGTLVRLVAVLATLSGVMVVALLIGLVSSTIGDKIEELRHGKSPVIDAGHTLILGFGAKAFPILRELREANANLKRATVVILSEVDKLFVEDQVREQMGDMRTTRVVVRQGSPFSVQDLKKVGAGRAKSIVVLAKGDGAVATSGTGDPDMDTIKTLLALRRVPGALTRNHAVVELIDAHRARVIRQLGQGGVEVVAMRETLARLMVQTARQTGLASVYQSLLTYEGSELYFKGFPELAGWAFKDVPAVLRRAVVVGVRQGVGGSSPKTVLNPPADLKLSASDELLVLAEDDDSFSVDLSRPVPIEPPLAGPVKAEAAKPERILIAGYRRDIGALLAEFDRYVQPGTIVICMAGSKDPDLGGALESASFQNLRIERLAGDPTDPASLQRVKAIGVTAALLVADDSEDPEAADARTVITLLLLREQFSHVAKADRPRVISEILDPRTQQLVTADELTDFVVSSEITSMLLAQVSERRELNEVFADLFDSDGNEIYLKSIQRYAPLETPVSWLNVQRAARQRGESALGLFRPGIEPLLNPPASGAMTFRRGDRVVVLAEDDAE